MLEEECFAEASQLLSLDAKERLERHASNTSSFSSDAHSMACAGDNSLNIKAKWLRWAFSQEARMQENLRT